MTSRNISKDIAAAEAELQRIIKTRARSDDVVGELLEREDFGALKSLGRLSGSEAQLAQKYMIAYVFLGEPGKAAQLSKRTGISADWSGDDEAHVVRRGYRSIANTAVLRVQDIIEINKDAVKRLRAMRELTGIGVPEDVKQYLLNAISDSRNHRISRTLGSYLAATGDAVDEASADRIIATAVSQTSGSRDILERARQIFARTGMRPVQSRQELLAGYLKTSSFHVAEEYLPLFVEPANREEVERFIASEHIPPHIAAVIRIASGSKPPPQETRELYQFVEQRFYALNELWWHDLEYLAQHGIECPEDILVELYSKIHAERNARRLAGFLPPSKVVRAGIYSRLAESGDYAENVLEYLGAGIYPPEEMQEHVYSRIRRAITNRIERLEGAGSTFIETGGENIY